MFQRASELARQALARLNFEPRPDQVQSAGVLSRQFRAGGLDLGKKDIPTPAQLAEVAERGQLEDYLAARGFADSHGTYSLHADSRDGRVRGMAEIRVRPRPYSEEEAQAGGPKRGFEVEYRARTDLPPERWDPYGSSTHHFEDAYFDDRGLRQLGWRKL